MSAPHVAGIAGLLESCMPTLSGPDKFNLIVNNTDPYNDSRDLGSGIANAKKALDAAGCTGVSCDIVADFSQSTTAGCAPLAVTFTDQSTGTGINAWSWDFGDGSPLSTAQNPSHGYAVAGSYTVTLTAFSNTCSDSVTKSALITVSDVPIADFSGSPTGGTTPLTVSFSDLSSGNPSSWSWDFGDGSPLSTVQNPSHSYTTANTFTVTLIATNVCGADAEVKAGYIVVNDPTPGVFVFDIVVTKENLGQGNKRGRAVVTIHDQSGPLSGVLVTGDFSGKTSDLGLTGTTNGSGQVTFLSSTARGGGEWCFEVTGVADSGYDQSLNNVTQSCESGDVF